MQYHFRIHKDPDGLWAECIELEGCLTQADTLADLEKNMREALSLFLDEPSDSRIIFPLPRKKVGVKDVVAVPVPPRIAFAFFMRQHRLQKGLTQREASERLGFKNIYSYQRLESGRTANPELTTLEKVRILYPDFSVDEILTKESR